MGPPSCSPLAFSQPGTRHVFEGVRYIVVHRVEHQKSQQGSKHSQCSGAWLSTISQGTQGGETEGQTERESEGVNASTIRTACSTVELTSTSLDTSHESRENNRIQDVKGYHHIVCEVSTTPAGPSGDVTPPAVACCYRRTHPRPLHPRLPQRSTRKLRQTKKTRLAMLGDPHRVHFGRFSIRRL